MDQTVAYPVVKRGLGDQLPPPTGPPPRSITSLTRNLWIIPARHGSPHQFKPDGAMMPPKKSADLTQAGSPPMLRKDHATFLGVQVPVVSFHGNILCPLGCRCRTSILNPSMMVKLSQCVEQNWRKLCGFNYLAKVITGVKFRDGTETKPDQIAA